MTAWRQLDLLNPRLRGRRPPPASEFKVHCAVADTLRRWVSPGWIWFHCPNGGARPAFINAKGRRISPEGGRLERMGVLPGVSDLLLVAPSGGRLHALELKQRGETPDDDQTAFLEAVLAAGGLAAWVDNYTAAIDQLKAWGALKTTIRVAA